MSRIMKIYSNPFPPIHYTTVPRDTSQRRSKSKNSEDRSRSRSKSRHADIIEVGSRRIENHGPQMYNKQIL